MNFDFVRGALTASAIIGLGCLAAKQIRLTKTSLELSIVFRELLHESEEVTFSYRAGEWRFRTPYIRSNVIREVCINVLEKLNESYVGDKHKSAFEEMVIVIENVEHSKWVSVGKIREASYKYTDAEYAVLTHRDSTRSCAEVSPIFDLNFVITSEGSRRFMGFVFKGDDGEIIIDVEPMSSYDANGEGYSEAEIASIVKEAYNNIVIVVQDMVERRREVKETLEAKLNRALIKSGLTVSDFTHV